MYVYRYCRKAFKKNKKTFRKARSKIEKLEIKNGLAELVMANIKS